MFVPKNHDLIWRLAGFTYPEKVFEFLKRFEDSFCVFSNSLRQLYSNYELVHSSSTEKTVITLPNFRAYHDTFFNIPEDAVVPTGLIISPGECKGTSGWLLCKKLRITGSWTGVPFMRGLDTLRKQYGDDNPFLPVLIHSDLRRSAQKDIPLMHLHRIDISKLHSLSELQSKDISRTIHGKIGVKSVW